MRPHRLIKFLKTGMLGQLTLGMSLEETLNYLGAPDGWASVDAFYKDLPRLRIRAAKNPKFNLLELLFRSVHLTYDLDRNELNIISLKFLPKYKPYVRFPQVLGLRNIHNLVGITREEFQIYVNQYELTFYVHPATDSGAFILFVPTSLVWVIFEMDPPPEKLYSMTVQSWFGLPPYDETSRWNTERE